MSPIADGTVGVKQATSPDKLIDNEELTVSSQTVERQRVVVFGPNNTKPAVLAANALVPVEYDEIVLTYTGSNVTTVVYKLATATVATLTLSYSGSNLIGVVRS